MEILEEVDNSRDGNDCYFYEKWCLVRVLGQKKVIRCRRVDGYRGEDLNIAVVTEPDYDTPEVVKGWLNRL